ncbi:MAG: beta-lactamase family protein [Deltaproteobacteria bacterium]|nr:beta-lactamase family protein [Deltaproteobacteria bacterium]
MLNGFIHPAYARLASALERQISRNGGGAAACVYQNGECVADVWGGVKDWAGNPWQRDTICPSFSTTKGVVATALHMLVDRGLLDYDDPVAKHWPEFAQAGKQGITVRQVLCHRAGLYNVRALVSDARQLLDWHYMVNALASAPAAPSVGDTTAYHGFTFGFLVGELVQRLAGKSLSQFLQEEIALPLGLDGLLVGTPSSEMPRVAELMRRRSRRRTRRSDRKRERAKRRRRRLGKLIELALRLGGIPADFKRSADALMPAGISHLDFSSEEVLRACIPAANGVFTARSLARLYACLAGGGALDGARLMSPGTILRAAEIQTTGVDHIIMFPMMWRLGYHRVATFRGNIAHAFGHSGYGGSGAWADPERDLSFAMVVNSGAGTPFGDLRIVRLNALVLECAAQYNRTSARMRCAGALPGGVLRAPVDLAS